MMISTHRSSQDRFATTRWSVVMHMAASPETDAGDALTELAQRYWFPVYAYLRRCGHAPALAQEIAGAFLQRLLRQFRDGEATAPRGHFRRFLLAQLNAFLAGDWRENTEQPEARNLLPPVELETRYRTELIDSGSPEDAYQRSFALEVLARAIKRLGSEANRAGHQDMFDALMPFLGNEPTPGVLDALAPSLHTRPLALLVALKRLRQRFRELVGEELADTVTNSEELAAENAALHAVLRGA
ncbi:MAG: hypothetical protein JSR27_07930 [Proteobacteria bacterium]|nr:hypothetical protein [Pseudomonadota bacterium]